MSRATSSRKIRMWQEFLLRWKALWWYQLMGVSGHFGFPTEKETVKERQIKHKQYVNIVREQYNTRRHWALRQNHHSFQPVTPRNRVKISCSHEPRLITRLVGFVSRHTSKTQCYSSLVILENADIDYILDQALVIHKEVWMYCISLF